MEEAAELCDRLVIMDHGRMLIEGAPTGLIEAHVGSSIIEVSGADQELFEFLAEREVEFDRMADRLVIYNKGNAEIEQAV